MGITDGCSLVGRVATPVVLNHTKSNKAVCNIRLAIEKDYTDTETQKQAVEFIDVTMWESLAEALCAKVQSGDLIAVSGRLDSMVDQDNKKIIIVIGEKFKLLSRAYKNYSTKD